MVQVIGSGTPRGPSFMQRLGAGVGRGLEMGQQLYQQKQQQDAYERLGIPAGTPPDLAKTYLGEQLRGQSKLNLQQEKSKADQLKGGQEQERLARAFKNIQAIRNDPNLSDEQKTLSLYEELSNNPSLAHHLQTSLHQHQQAQEKDVAGQHYAAGVRAIQDNDIDALNDILDDPETPISVKRDLRNELNKSQVRKDVRNREVRARQALVQRSYKAAIENLRKLSETVTPKERAQYLKEIKRLEALQRADMQMLNKDPDNYSKLNIWGAVDPDYLPEEEGEPESEGMKADGEAILNSLTDAQIQALVKESNGDIEVAKKLAIERYGR